MGMNGGIHDAHELVATLAEIANGGSLDLLDRYVRRRRPIAEQEILVQADRNRARMQERAPARRLEMLRELQRIAGDRNKAREHLLRTSMITGLRQAAAIEIGRASGSARVCPFVSISVVAALLKKKNQITK